MFLHCLYVSITESLLHYYVFQKVDLREASLLSRKDSRKVSHRDLHACTLAFIYHHLYYAALLGSPTFIT